MNKFLAGKFSLLVITFLYASNLFAVCDNVTASGTISGNETGCGIILPSTITNLTYPSGGTGTLQYQWQVSTDASTWTNISWATMEAYSPSNLSDTTYYKRLERRSGCVVYTGSSNIITKTVNPRPTPTITAGGPVNFCGQPSVALTANAAVGVTYQWLRNAFNITGATNISYAVTLEGNYAVVETITATGCDAQSNGILVTSSNYSPTAISYTKSNNACDTSLGLLSAGTGGGNSYQWYEDGNLLPGSIGSYYMTGHNGNFSCTITNACGIFPSPTYLINDPVLDMMPFGVISSNGINSICSGQSINIYETSMVNAVNYQWFKDGVAIPGAYSNLYTASQFGTYTLRFTIPCMIWSGIDPIDFYSNAITITNNGGTAPAPSISAGGSTTPCPGQSVLLTEVTGPGWTYQWRKDGIQISGATNSTYSVNSSGSFQCYVSNFCGSFPSNIITVTFQPTSEIISVNGTGIVCQGTPAILTSTTAGSGGTYQWKLNGSNIGGATQITYNATVSGSYTCSITNSCGTYLSNDIAITVASSCGTGLQFDGVNDYVEVPNNNSYSFGSGDFTIEAWIKIDPTSTGGMIISNFTSSLIGFRLNYTSSQLLFSVPINSISVNRNLRDNVCHHVAISRVNSLITLYIDGIPYNSIVSSSDVTTQGNIRIGASPLGGLFAKGNIMEVRMWNTGRTAAQVLGSMNTSLIGTEAGLVGYWGFNDGSGQVANDFSLTNNDGQLGSTGGTDVNDPTFQATCAIAPAINCNLPTGLNTTNITNTSAQLNWGGAAADSFMVRYAVHNTTNFVWKKFSGQPNVTSTIITSLLPATQYDWWVRSLCNSGSSSNYQSIPATFTTTSTPVPCVTPYGLNATNIGNTSATISWTTMVTADTFRVRYSVNGTTNFIWKDVNGTGGSSTSLTGLSPNTTYQFQVSSKCNGATSPYSSSKVFTTLNTPVPCITPYNPGATNIQNTSATITWTNMVTADTFRVRYSVNGTTNFIWKDVNGGGGSSTSLTNLLPNTTYQFQVSSKCNGITSAYSTSYVFTTLNTPVPCIVPYGLSTTNITNNSAKVNWTNLVSADTFRVRYSINGTTNFMWKDVSGAGGTTNTTLTGLNSSATYQWQVRTICNGVQGPYSSSVIFSTAAMRSADISSSNGFENLVMYPNPAHSKSTAEFSSDKPGNGVVTVSDLTGRILYTEPFTIREGLNVLEIDVATLPRGIYLVQLQDENSISSIVKLVVE